MYADADNKEPEIDRQFYADVCSECKHCNYHHICQWFTPNYKTTIHELTVSCKMFQWDKKKWENKQ